MGDVYLPSTIAIVLGRGSQPGKVVNEYTLITHVDASLPVGKIYQSFGICFGDPEYHLALTGYFTTGRKLVFSRLLPYCLGAL